MLAEVIVLIRVADSLVEKLLEQEMLLGLMELVMRWLIDLEMLLIVDSIDC